MARYKTIKYFFGVYIDYTDDKKPRIAQVTTSVDDLSCEMLADPGCITFHSDNLLDAINIAKYNAKKHNCQYLEKGWGNYHLIRIK